MAGRKGPWAYLTGQEDDEKEKRPMGGGGGGHKPPFPPKKKEPGEGDLGAGGGGDDFADLLDDGPSEHGHGGGHPLDIQLDLDGPGGGSDHGGPDGGHDDLSDLLDGDDKGGEKTMFDAKEMQHLRDGVKKLLEGTDDPSERTMLEQLLNKIETLPDQVLVEPDPHAAPGDQHPDKMSIDGPGGDDDAPGPMSHGLSHLDEGGGGDAPPHGDDQPGGGSGPMPSHKPSKSGLDAMAFLTRA